MEYNITFKSDPRPGMYKVWVRNNADVLVVNRSFLHGTSTKTVVSKIIDSLKSMNMLNAEELMDKGSFRTKFGTMVSHLKKHPEKEYNFEV